MARDIGFFPLDELDAAADFVATSPRDLKLSFLKGYLRNPVMAELVCALEEEEERKEKLRVTATGIYNKYYLLKNAYEADLIWAVGELKAILAHWGDTESPALNGSVQQRVENLVAKLSDKNLEF